MNVRIQNLGADLFNPFPHTLPHSQSRCSRCYDYKGVCLSMCQHELQTARMGTSMWPSFT